MITNQFVWKRQYDPAALIPILEMVEPYKKERDVILKCIELGICYRAYVARDYLKLVVAIAIATILPKTQTLHVEDFALHPRIRGKGHARELWKSWRLFVRSDWTSIEALTIEVYMHNIEPWRKIMGVTELLPQPVYLLPLAPNVPMVFMGRQLTSSVSDVLAEWQSIQRDVAIILNQSKL